MNINFLNYPTHKKKWYNTTHSLREDAVDPGRYEIIAGEEDG